MARPQPAGAVADLQTGHGAGPDDDLEAGPDDGHDDGHQADGDVLSVLSEAVAAVEEAGIPYVLMGGIGSAAFGRPRSTHDIDFFVRPESARPVLQALAAAGFETEERDPRWLFKGYKHDILVDVIFRSSGDIYLDEEMLAPGADLAIHGHAHNGTERSVTPGGVHVRNVAQPVLRRACAVYCLEAAVAA